MPKEAGGEKEDYATTMVTAMKDRLLEDKERHKQNDTMTSCHRLVRLLTDVASTF